MINFRKKNIVCIKFLGILTLYKKDDVFAEFMHLKHGLLLQSQLWNVIQIYVISSICMNQSIFVWIFKPKTRNYFEK